MNYETRKIIKLRKYFQRGHVGKLKFREDLLISTKKTYRTTNNGGKETAHAISNFKHLTYRKKKEH